MRIMKHRNQALSVALAATALLFSALTATGQIAPGVGRTRKTTTSSTTSVPLPTFILPAPAAPMIGILATTPAAPCPSQAEYDSDLTTLSSDCVLSIGSTKLFESLPGAPSEDQTITLSLTQKKDGTFFGQSAYVIDSALLTGDPKTLFHLTNCDINELNPNADRCDFTVNFQSSAATQLDAILTVLLHDKNNSQLKYELQIPLHGIAHALCSSFVNSPDFAHVGGSNFAPLTRSTTNNSIINCFYNTSSNVAGITQARYQYNPAGSASNLSADLISTQFMGGFQVTLSAVGSTSSCNAAATSTANPTSNSCAGSTPTAAGTSQASLTQDVQQLTQGGDFGIRVLWPAFHYESKLVQVSNFLTPKVGFTVSGLSSTVNATSATNVNAFYADESYLQLFSIPVTPGQASTASIFFDHRWGIESVDPAFVQSAALTHHNFLMQQFSVGIVLNNTIKISGERYKGANQNLYVNASGAPLSVNNFNNWQLSVQLSPTSKN